MNLRQNSSRQVQGVKRNKRMRVASPLVSLYPSPLSLSSLSLSLWSLTRPLTPLVSLTHPLTLPSLSLSLSLSLVSHSPLNPSLSLSLSLSLPLVSHSTLNPPCLSPSSVFPLHGLSPIGRHLSLQPVSLACHSSLSVPHLYTPYTAIAI